MHLHGGRTDPFMSAPGLTLLALHLFKFSKAELVSFAIQVFPALPVQLFSVYRTHTGIPHNLNFHTGRQLLSFSGYFK
jgi:hypothetical protein